MTAIAIDAGTTTIKVVGYADDGEELAVSRRPTQVTRPRPRWAEQDMSEVWAAVADAVREVVAALPDAPDMVAVTAQGDGAWLVDDRGRPTGPAVLWNDGRATDQVAAWERDGVAQEAFRISGSRLSAGMPNAVLAWLRANDPDRVDRSAHLLTCGGWLHLKLTGEAAVDESDASAPFMDIRQRDWSDRLFELYDLRETRRLLPELRDDDNRVTALGDSAAAETGLPAGIPVVMAPYDICATAIGAGAVTAGQACCILGTTLATEVITDTVVTDEPVGITVTLGVPGRYLRAFPTMSGGDVLEWGAGMLGLTSVTDLMDLAARGAPDAAGVRFVPYLSPAGERAPFFDPTARGSLSGLSLEADREDVARALLEGVTMTIRDCLAAAPGSPDGLALCGGGTRSDFWMRLIADVTGLPVTIPATAEVGARGAWLTGLVATGREPDFPTAAARHVRVAATYRPDRKAFDDFSGRYADFLRLRELARPLWTHGRGTRSTGGADA
ncbi:FGGY-family carbohydrate kinase [Streptomyces alkaliterrae]|uniref:Carbohydrate kinase n=1 Tax=Streptomyces alkaliterrae TaxID=2213162 RepID=A0A5P0YL92_9ACTN|nr:FGGY-family carbohydrate kinase [Streptomyces alkaliterrae]MBB1257792.1 carbohydrate kinase [Streptomyces alkaliterrae]MQS01018.1 carbohydrate kinase [Streptomyces alkaliterrae]